MRNPRSGFTVLALRKGGDRLDQRVNGLDTLALRIRLHGQALRAALLVLSLEHRIRGIGRLVFVRWPIHDGEAAGCIQTSKKGGILGGGCCGFLPLRDAVDISAPLVETGEHGLRLLQGHGAGEALPLGPGAVLAFDSVVGHGRPGPRSKIARWWQPAAHVERPHAVGTHVAQGHRRPRL
jgi:hypothetical protein